MGSFFEGFADSFAKGQDKRKLREQLKLEDAKEQRREAIQQEQFQQRHQQQERQFQAMESFRADQTKLRQKQIDLETRARDVALVKEMSIVFDPKIPKMRRKFMWQMLQDRLGVDPKSEQSKRATAYVENMDEEEAATMSAALSALWPDAEPGQVFAMSKLFAEGGGDVTSISALIDAAAKRKDVKQINEQFDPLSDSAKRPDGGIDIFATDEGGGILEKRQAQIKIATEKRDAFLAKGLEGEARSQQNIIDGLSKAGEFEPEVKGAIKSAEIKAEDEAKLDQPASPKHLRLSGIDPKVKMTKRHARDLGIDTDLDDKTVLDLNRRKAAVHSSMKQIDELTDMIEPGAIGIVGAAAKKIDSFLSQAMSIGDVLGMSRAEFGKATKKAEMTMGLAEKSAIISSRIVDLAYDMAKARDGGRLSNQDIERFQEMLGKSGSENQFKAVLQDMKDRLRSGASTDIEALNGVKPIDLMTKEELDTAIDEFEDEDMIRSIIKEQGRRKKEFSIRGQK